MKCIGRMEIVDKRCVYHLVIQKVFVVAVQNTNDSMHLRRLFGSLGSVEGIKWQSLHLRQCHIVVESYGLVYVADRIL